MRNFFIPLKAVVTVGATLVAVACSDDGSVECEESRTCQGSGQSGASGSVGAGAAGESADGGQGGEIGVGGAPVGGQGGADSECRNDADCDDAEPKNGVENCELGACVGGNPPPSVVAMIPEDMEVEVEPDGTVIIEFSEELNAGTITAETVKLMDGDVEVQGTVSYSGVAWSAIFTPEVPLSLLTPYTVVVKKDIADLEGAAMLADFSSVFAVRDGSWSEPQGIESVDVTLGSFDASLCVDGSGNALVVWHEAPDDSRVNALCARWYRNGSWGTRLILANTEVSDDFGCAINARGDAIVAWTRAAVDLYARQYRNGSWEPEALDIAAAWGGGPLSVGMSPTGEAHVIWSASDAVRAIKTNAAGSWSDGSDVVGAQWYTGPRLAFDAAGNGFAIWRAWDASMRDHIYASSYLASTETWYPGDILPGSQSANTNFKRGMPAIAMGEGQAMAAWVSQTAASSFGLMTSHHSTSGTWTTSEPGANFTGTVTLAEPPALVAVAGGFLYAWNRPNGASPSTLAVSRYLEGTWGDHLWGGSPGYPGTPVGKSMPRLGIDAHGNVLLIWASTTPILDSFALTYQRFSSVTSTWLLADTAVVTPMLRTTPVLGVGSNGTAAAIWTDRDLNAAATDIFASLFR